MVHFFLRLFKTRSANFDPISIDHLSAQEAITATDKKGTMVDRY